MTMLSELLKLEQYDMTEPAGFYVPGSKDWEEVIYAQKNNINSSGKADEDDEK